MNSPPAPQDDDDAPQPDYDGRLRAIESRLHKGGQRMDVLEEALLVNTGLTRDIHDILAAAKTGFKVLGWTGTAIKWLGMVAGAALAIYTAVYASLHGGATPK
jgi:hypothetical protein